MRNSHITKDRFRTPHLQTSLVSTTNIRNSPTKVLQLNDYYVFMPSSLYWCSWPWIVVHVELSSLSQTVVPRFPSNIPPSFRNLNDLTKLDLSVGLLVISISSSLCKYLITWQFTLKVIFELKNFVVLLLKTDHWNYCLNCQCFLTFILLIIIIYSCWFLHL